MLFFNVQFSAQSGTCDPSTPFYSVDLTNDPNGTWVSPPDLRDGHCCGATNGNAKCIEFELTLSPDAVAISFDIVSGAVPSGALFYQIDCGPQVSVGEPICISGAGPHTITFCKPGNNQNEYSITSIPAPDVSPDDSVGNDCTVSIFSTGLDAQGLTWTTVGPGAVGQYDSFLSCQSNCTSTTVTPSQPYPAYVDVQVCGNVTSPCASIQYCDTIRVAISPNLDVVINPQTPTICFGQTSANLTAIGSGGVPPYTFLWNNVNPSETIIVGAGTYTVQMWDANGCPPVTDQVTVVAFNQPIDVDAGPDDTICIQNPLVELSADLYGALGVKWSGGNGTFSPNDSAINNLFYTPTAAELNSGSVQLFVSTTGNGGCPPDSDTINIIFQDFTGMASFSNTDVSCYGLSDGIASVQINGGPSPYSYSWNTIPVQTTSSITNLPIGNYVVNVEDGIGCVNQFTTTIAQPTPLLVSSTHDDITCFGGLDGEITLLPSGGTPPYSYSWQTVSTADSIANGLSAGTYIFDVIDNNSCTISDTVILTEPSPITISFDSTNVSCFGGSDGSVTAIASGGTGNLNYSWTGQSGTSNILTGLTAGTYEVTVTDASGCVEISSVTITEPAAPISATETIVDVLCFGDATGEIQTTISGGTAPYSYLWTQNGDVNSTTSGLIAGNYDLTVTDSKGCIESFSYVVNEFPELIVSTSVNNVNCFGGSDGSAIAYVTGGNPNYSFSWSSNPSSTSSASGFFEGSYSVDVTDANGCVQTSSFVITEPTAPLSVIESITDVSCYQGSDGSISLTSSGGTPPYLYNWLPYGQSTSNISSLLAGTYDLEIIDSNGCSANYSYIVNEPTELTLTITGQNVSCFGGSDGEAFSTVIGGTSSYSYNWSNGQTSANTSNLAAGVVTLFVTDNNECIDSASLTITEPTALQSTTSSTPVSCFGGNDGTVSVNGSFGTSPYTYLWQAGGETSTSVSGLSAGLYYVNITDNNGCEKTDSVEVIEPTQVIITEVQLTDVNCFGGNDGSITVASSGGTPSYTYSWNSNPSVSAMASGFSAGSYSLDVTDNNGCLATYNFVIAEPAAPISITSTITDVSCINGSDGEINVVTVGGTSPYSYSWLPYAQSTPSISNLVAGSYSLEIEDANGCSDNYSFAVNEPTAISITLTPVDVSCNGSSDGQVSSLVSGGTSPYSYLWSDGQTTPNASSLPAGSIGLIVTDNNGCMDSLFTSLSEPTILQSTTSSTSVSCNGGSDGTASVVASFGTSPYTYLWSPSGSTSSTATNLAAGTHFVTVTDNNGCTRNDSAVVTEPDLIIVNTVLEGNVSCNGGSDGYGEVEATGGTPNYSYFWPINSQTSPNVSGLSIGTFTVDVTDANGCIGSGSVTISEPTLLTVSTPFNEPTCFGGTNGDITASPSGGIPPYEYYWTPGNVTNSLYTNTSAGNYSVTVTDANGCEAVATTTVTEPAPIVLSNSTTNADCGLPTGTATVNITSGGSGSYSYLWTPSGQTTSTATNLVSGNYSVLVTDSDGCTASGTSSVNDNVAAIINTTVLQDASCFGGSDGSATASPVGGVGPFTYEWLPSGETTQTAVNLSAGINSVNVYASNGCISSATVTISQSSKINTTLAKTNVSCNGGANGTAAVSASGGSGVYSYLWTPSGSTSNTATGLSTGWHYIQVTDNNSCSVLDSTFISQPALPLSISTLSTDVSCFGGTNGTAVVTASGGTSPYSYMWTPINVSAQAVSSLSAGNYTITVTDSKGCSTNEVVAINEPAPLASIPAPGNSFCGYSNATAYVTVTGGSGVYNYNWTPYGGSSDTAYNLIAGTYNILITDSKGCTLTETLSIVDEPAPVATISSQTNVSCYGGNDGTATLSISSGSGPYTYEWFPFGGNSDVATGLTAGNYFAIITDVNGCESAPIFTQYVTQPTPLVLSISETDVSCFGGNDGEVSLTISGGTSTYNILWSDGTTAVTSLSNQLASSGNVTVTDSKGCVADSSYSIEEPTDLILTTSVINDVSCFGGNDGNAQITLTGGTPGYLYNWNSGQFNSSSVNNLSEGTYNIVITDLNGCEKNASIDITEPTELTSTISSTNSFCGLANGTATVVVSGGTGTYSYNWTPSGGSNDVANNLLAGDYYVEVIDGNGCSINDMVTVNNDPGPTATLLSQSDVSCFGGNDGTAEVTVTSGTGPFTYSWFPSGGSSAIASNLSIGNYYAIVYDGNNCPSDPVFTQYVNQPLPIVINVIENSTSCFGGNDGSVSISINGGTPGYNTSWSNGTNGTLSISSQIASTGNVVVTDSKGCVADSTYTISEPDEVVPTINVINDVSCFSGADGTAEVTTSGGTPGYNYSWNSGSYSGSLVNTLSAGIYTVIATDNNGCTGSTNVTINEPSTSISATSTIVQNSCFGSNNGSITINPTGGTPGYTYVWSPSGSTNQTISNLNPGNYIATVSDSKNCSVTINAQITQPTPLSGSLIKVDPSCGFSNGTLTCSISGGTPPYTYNWSSTTSNQSVISGLAPGNYSLTVTDDQGCSLVLDATLINIPGPTLSLQSQSDVSCYGFSDGEATIVITSGTAPYDVLWLPAGGNNTLGSQLSAGTYTAQVTDDLGCVANQTVIINEPQPLSIDLVALNDVSCFGFTDGSIEVSANGGTSPYTMNWSNSSQGAFIDNLSSNSYTLVASDLNGCITNMTYTIDQPSALTSEFINIVNPTCFTGNDGEATIIVSGGTPGYDYHWNDGQTGNIAYALEDGTYEVEYTDANGCTGINVIDIVEPNEIITTPGNDGEICFGQSTIVSATATGGNGPYSFAWQPTSAINSGVYNVTPTESTDYLVQSFDQFGCPGNIASIPIIVYNLDIEDVSIHVTDSLICPGESVVLYAIEDLNQNDTLLYSWNNGLGTSSGSFLVTPGDSSVYTLQVTNGCGQTADYEVIVLHSDPPVINFQILNDTVCLPESTIFYDSSYSSASDDPIESWYWDFGDGQIDSVQSPTHLYDDPGEYNITLTITTWHGCVNDNSSAPALVVAYPSPIAAFSLNQTVFEIPIEPMIGTNQSANATQYYWDFGDGSSSTNEDISYLYTAVGDYEVYLVAANDFGCTDTAFQDVITTSSLVFPNAFTPNASGGNGGIYDVTSLNNDIFFPYTSGVVEYQLMIFNRWGELIFETDDINTGWDGYYNGVLCQQGVYAYRAFAMLNDGRRFQQIGNVTLLRLDD